jgi:hypothetical protein
MNVPQNASPSAETQAVRLPAILSLFVGRCRKSPVSPVSDWCRFYSCAIAMYPGCTVCLTRSLQRMDRSRGPVAYFTGHR